MGMAAYLRHHPYPRENHVPTAKTASLYDRFDRETRPNAQDRNDQYQYDPEVKGIFLNARFSAGRAV
jgi:hypothetical protein